MLAFDALVLWKASGQMPTKGTIIHGLQHTILGLRLDTLIHEVQLLVGKLRALLSESIPPDPVLIKHCSECEFETYCRKRVAEKDDLSLLDSLSVTERAKLNAKGIFTVTQLAYTFRPRRRPKRLASRKEKYHHALKALAIRDHKIHIVGKPELAIKGTPVYLDVEGMPDRDFYYLIGLRIPAGPLQYSFWADDVSDEEGIWRSLLSVLERIDNPVLIHYGAYETTFLKRLARRYSDSNSRILLHRHTHYPRDESLGDHLFADLFSNIFQSPQRSRAIPWVPVVAPGCVGAPVPRLATTMGGKRGIPPSSRY